MFPGIKVIYKYIKPKHRVKKGKKYIWKYKNSDEIWMHATAVNMLKQIENMR